MERARKNRPLEGDERLSGKDKAEPPKGDRAPHAGGQARDEKIGTVEGGATVATKKKTSRPADVGRALRSVYDDTLREDIPSDLKDLLSRLG